jgi:sec-independent protein translocase protein TatB
MFDVGWSELVVIAVVALIAIGPKELPGVLRSVGYWMGKVRQMAAEFQGQFQEAMREAEMSDLKKHADDLNNMAKGLTSGLNATFDPYDTLKESEAATPKATPAGDTPSADANAPAGEPTPSPAPPDYSQVVAMPDIAPPAPEDVVPAPAPPSPVRRDA